MKNSQKHLILILLSFLLSCLSYASDETRYYDVEIVLFENLQPGIKSAEDWPSSIEYQYPEKALFISDPYPGLIPESLNPRFTFKPVIRANYVLADEVRLLKKSEKFKILYHRAWRQPGLDEENAIAVKIKRQFPPKRATPLQSVNSLDPTGAPQAQNTPQQPGPEELFGTIRVVLKRYLHVQTDIHFKTYKLEAQQTINSEFESIAEQQLRPVIISLSGSRKMRSKELHYIDNPVIGMLVYIKQFKTK